jgi:hypothetical protein
MPDLQSSFAEKQRARLNVSYNNIRGIYIQHMSSPQILSYIDRLIKDGNSDWIPDRMYEVLLERYRGMQVSELFMAIDWDLLREQKLELIISADYNDSSKLGGIIELIDYIQDVSVFLGLKTEDEVFGEFDE